MLTYPFQSLLAVMLFAAVHLFANQARRWDVAFHSRFLSIGSGIALAYVFIDLLPKFSKNEPVVSEAIKRIFPYFERHVYVIALLGFLLFFAVDRAKGLVDNKPTYFYLSLASYALFNFLIGYAVVDKDNPEVQPLLLFTIAIALHYFVNDYSLTEALGEKYDGFPKWILIAFLFLGWITGLCFELSTAAVALVSAFIGGGVIMNVTRHELPDEHHNSLLAFLSSAIIYTLVLLMIG